MPFVKDDPNINRKGRPKGSVSLTSAIRKRLALIPEGEKRARIEEIVDIIIDKAIKEKDSKIIQLIWNYMDGTPKQSVELSGELEIGKILTKEEQSLLDNAINLDYGDNKSKSKIEPNLQNTDNTSTEELPTIER